MTEMTKQEKTLLVSGLTQTELEVVFAASCVFSRVFPVSSIKPRLKTNFSDTGIYSGIKGLENKGIFFVDKEENNQLSIRLTVKGRSICRLVKERINANNTQDFTQSLLF